MSDGQLDYQQFNNGRLSAKVKFNYANRTTSKLSNNSLPGVKMNANLLMPGRE